MPGTFSEPHADRLLIAETLCARLCHDLSSPLGTLIGTLELAVEEAGAAAEALALGGEAAAELGARLRLLRAAWTGDCGPLGPDQLASLAHGLPRRVRADLDGLRGGPFPPAVARVLVNLLLLGAEALPKGGIVALSGEPGGDVLATVAGPSARWPTILPAALADGGAGPFDDPRTVQAPLSALLARAAGLRLSMLMPSGPAAAVPPLLLARLT